MALTIRPERSSDKAGLRRVHLAVFGRPDEGDLVDTLRASGAIAASMVAELKGEIVGHALFSHVQIGALPAAIPGAALGPAAVLPEAQRHGVGITLIQAGLARLRTMGIPACVVLGHPDYYPRFGFVPASEFGLTCHWDMPDPVFMAMELRPGTLDAPMGEVQYLAAYYALG